MSALAAVLELAATPAGPPPLAVRLHPGAMAPLHQPLPGGARPVPIPPSVHPLGDEMPAAEESAHSPRAERTRWAALLPAVFGLVPLAELSAGQRTTNAWPWVLTPSAALDLAVVAELSEELLLDEKVEARVDEAVQLWPQQVGEPVAVRRRRPADEPVVVHVVAGSQDCLVAAYPAQLHRAAPEGAPAAPLGLDGRLG